MGTFVLIRPAQTFYERIKVERFSLPPGALEDGTEIGRIRPMLGYTLERQVKVVSTITPSVIFDQKGPGRGLPVGDTLRDINAFIESQIYTDLAQFIL